MYWLFSVTSKPPSESMSDLFSLSGWDTVLWLHPEPHCNTEYINLKCLFYLSDWNLQSNNSVSQRCCRDLLLSSSFYILGGVLSHGDHCKNNFLCFLLWKACPSFACMSIYVWMHVWLYFLLESRQYKEWKSYMTSSQLPVMNTEYKIKLKPRMLKDNIRSNLNNIYWTTDVD